MASWKWPTWRSATRCSISIWAGANRPEACCPSKQTGKGTMAEGFKRVLVAGAARYGGSILVPKLLTAGYGVSGLDRYLYGDVFADKKSDSRLPEVKGDWRTAADVARAVSGCDA